jgi:hypothetical protein
MFFKALALGLSVPLAAKLARLALAAPTAPVKRFFLLYMPHGIPPEHYNPRGMGRDFVLNQTNLSILGGLEPYKPYVNVYQGFKYPGGSTHSGIVSCLSGVQTVDTSTPRTSLEHVIAKGLGVKPLILGACSHIPSQLDANGMLFWDGTAVDPEKNPVKVADRLFGGNPTMPPVDADALLRTDLLALTASEIQGLQSTLGNLTTEKTKLQRHLEAIQSLSSGTGGAQSTCSTRPTLPTVEMVRTATAGLVTDPNNSSTDYFYQERNFPLLMKAQMELATQALLCNAAQVIALMPMYATAEFDFSFSRLPGAGDPPSGWGHHAGLSHTQPQWVPGAQYNSPITVDNANPTIRAAFAGAQLWFAQQLVKTVQVLATTDDPSAPGTKVLDNTLIYWMSEIGDGQDHTTASKILFPQFPTYLPLVSIGKCGGAINSGQLINYATDHPAGELYLAFARAMGASTATFPDATAPAPGVLV